ncbi:MAG TPA: hypothetical protein VGQ57_04445 [Polyangiaceae bacterium]|nr:hypothetical protein [Polyangiaceae bacterium]
MLGKPAIVATAFAAAVVTASAHDTAAPAPPQAPAVSTVLVRLGDALMPLACLRGRLWGNGQGCLPQGPVDASLYPHLSNEEATRSATPSSIYFKASKTDEPGLLLDKTSGESPALLLGFGVVGKANPVRLTPRVLETLTKTSRAWCKPTCTVVAPAKGDTDRVLATRPATAGETQAARAWVQANQHAPPTAGASKPQVLAVVSVQLHGAPLELINVEAAAPAEPGKKKPAGGSAFYLLRSSARGLQAVEVNRDDDADSGDAGELVGAIDLDGDGNDELLLEWRHGEVRYYELGRFSGERLVVMGQSHDDPPGDRRGLTSDAARPKR